MLVWDNYKWTILIIVIIVLILLFIFLFLYAIPVTTVHFYAPSNSKLSLIIFTHCRTVYRVQ